MKKVELIFNGLGYNDILQADIIIYNISNEILYQCKTYNGRAIVYLESDSNYIVIAKSNVGIIKKYFYLTNNCNKYIFSFDRCILHRNISRVIAFHLTDKNYKNLPIMKGMITLWQKQ